MVYARKEADLRNNTRVLYVEAPFDQALAAIDSKDGVIITAKQLADARMQFDRNHSLSTNGSYIREGNLFVPNSEHRRVLLRNSLIFGNPAEAVKAHRSGNEYNIPGTVDSVLGKLKEGKDYIFLDKLDAVPTDRFGEDGRMVFLFGKSAQDYGLWLNNDGKGVKETGFYNFRNDSHIDKQSGMFADQLWLHWLVSGSDVNGCGRSLSDNLTVRGVQSIGEAGAKKKPIVQTYTPKQMDAYVRKGLHQAGISGDLEKRIITNIANIRK